MLGCGARRRQFGRYLGHEPGVAGQTEQIIDPVRLAPCHQRFPAEARIGAQKNAHPWPALADLLHNAPHLRDRSGGAGDVRGAQLGRQQMPPAEYVKRQVAVAIVIALEEPAFLVAVQRIVGGVEIEDDLLGRCRMRFQEQIDEQPLDRGFVMADPRPASV